MILWAGLSFDWYVPPQCAKMTEERLLFGSFQLFSVLLGTFSVLFGSSFWFFSVPFWSVIVWSVTEEDIYLQCAKITEVQVSTSALHFFIFNERPRSMEWQKWNSSGDLKSIFSSQPLNVLNLFSPPPGVGGSQYALVGLETDKTPPSLLFSLDGNLFPT